MTNIMKMMKQAQEMQAKMVRLEEELAREEFEVSSGGGAVTVRMTGKQQLVKLTIRDDVLKDADKAMLEDLIVAAVNEAQEKAGQHAKEKMAAITGGLKLPGLF
jgi:DNA-binding YbaB/EbfC family protein